MVAPALNPTQLTPPRVAVIDERTGAISREWYRFFLSLLNATETTQQETSLAVDTNALLASYDAMILDLAQSTESAPDAYAATVSLQSIIEAQTQALALAPPSLDAQAILALSASPAPVTKTADFTVANGETWIINNKSGSTCTVTLPAASSGYGRTITFQNYQDQLLVSASSNVVPRAGGAAGTAILDAVAGNWATLVSDGTNWVIMQAAPFNCMLI